MFSDTIILDRVVLHKHGAAALTALLLVVAFAATSMANDAAMGGRGIDLSPIENVNVQMVSENIRIDQVEGSDFEVHASYVFRNPTSEQVVIRMGFPERRCGDDMGHDCNGDGSFSEMLTTVRGQQVPLTVGEVGSRSEWGDELGRVFLFDVTFEPGETVQIEHRYLYSPTVSVDGPIVEYVTKTGALWAGPIESAIFTVSFRQPACSTWTVSPSRDGIVESRRDAERATYVFRFSDWTPTHDIEIGPVTVGYEACQHMIYLDCPYFEAETLAESDSVETLGQELAANAQYDDAQLRICRNMPYALVGYRFRSEDLNQLFYGRATEEPEYDEYVIERSRPNLENPANIRLPAPYGRYVQVIQRAERIRAQQ